MGNDIKLLKPGQTGFGLMVETDAGYISPNDIRNKPFITEIQKLTEGKNIIAEPLILYVVLQKYGVENRNGRIYPRAILERENENYQQLIREHRALGENEHPECHRDTAEILTDTGWKFIKDISENENVLTLNPETGNIEINTINKKIESPFKGKLISIKSNNIDLQVTPNHRFWVIQRNGKGKFITAQDIHDRTIPDLDKMYIPKLGNRKEKRLIKKGNSMDMNFVHISTTKCVYLDKRNVSTELVDYDGNVYSVDVPNHIYYVRDHNKACWNGNSSIINSERVSHNIIETWWEGKTLMGKMEIIMSPGYINQGIISCQGDHVANLLRKGIMIGVSSRGVGSLQEVDGKAIVQDDFELICWDIVTSPSTPGSWMFHKKEDTARFTENVNIKKPLLADNLDKFLKN